ncbi:MAG: PKD domain-containing protein, partial [Thermoplasmatota archaeon]
VPVTKSHSWLSSGNYYIKAKAKDGKDAESAWSDTFTFTVSENQPPNTPEINGTTSGKPKVEYTYKLKTSDPNNDDVFYFVNWGDGSSTDWIGPFASGEEISVNHSFSKKGKYTISVRAKDEYNLTSNWATIEVNIPRTRSHENFLIKILFERFSRIIQILGFLLNF